MHVESKAIANGQVQFEFNESFRDLVIQINGASAVIPNTAYASLKITSSNKMLDKTIIPDVPLNHLMEFVSQIGEGFYIDRIVGASAITRGRIMGTDGNSLPVTGDDTVILKLHGLDNLNGDTVKLMREQAPSYGDDMYIYTKDTVKAVAGGLTKEIDVRGLDYLLIEKANINELHFDYIKNEGSIGEVIRKDVDELNAHYDRINDLVKVVDAIDVDGDASKEETLIYGSDLIYVVPCTTMQFISIKTNGSEVLYTKVKNTSIV